MSFFISTKRTGIQKRIKENPDKEKDRRGGEQNLITYIISFQSLIWFIRTHRTGKHVTKLIKTKAKGVRLKIK